MLLVTGRTAGLSSRAFEGRYKEPWEIRDIHIANHPRNGGHLINFTITNNPNDLTLISFDIPGGGTRVYSRIREVATWMLCPRIDNTTYLTPSLTIGNALLAQIPNTANVTRYFVEPLDKAIVERALANTLSDLVKYAKRRITALLNARGRAAADGVKLIDGLTEVMVYSAREWVRRGYAVNMRLVDGLARALSHTTQFKASNSLEGLS
ncbi:MAG: hypothetical protein RQ838_04450 [Caldivirga sp.]|jgi:hypothetical protein|nr:hypothetical protein [Caldivirga sp.]